MTIQSSYRQSTWLLFIALGAGGYYLEQHLHEMHVSKLLYFAALGVWARDWPKPQRLIMLAMIGTLWLAILVPWFQYRNQHLVPIGKGAYRIENE